MTCNVCGGTGFINIEQIEDAKILAGDIEGILEWIKNNEDHDVAICHCCGDGEDWYGEPGCHYGSDDPMGPNGPYAYNGGLCLCN